jgi:hypothetical protein
VLGHLVGVRNGNGWFTTAELAAMYEALRIPSPANLSDALGKHRLNHFVIAGTGENRRRWSLTPLGVERVRELLSTLNYSDVEVDLAGTPGAEYAHVRHTVIPPTFAPPSLQIGLRRHLYEFPFERGIFCMTRFPRVGMPDPPDPQQAVIDTIREVVSQHGLTLHLASDRQIVDDLFGNVAAHMWACQYGIGLLENRESTVSGLNENVLIELGSMLIMGRRCAILKDKGAPQPPSDLSSQIYKTVDFEVQVSVSAATHRWLADDLGLGRCTQCPPLGS